MSIILLRDTCRYLVRSTGYVPVVQYKGQSLLNVDMNDDNNYPWNYIYIYIYTNRSTAFANST